ncbi:MAG: hypothetical protein ACYTAF_05215 [Planctomycetota bacterium]|jgi:predicted esterase
MAFRWTCLFVLLFTVALPAQDRKKKPRYPKNRAISVARKYASADDAKRLEILRELKEDRELEEIPLKDAKGLIARLLKVFKDDGPELKEGTQKFSHKKYPGTVIVHKGSGKGLMLGLHGGGANSGNPRSAVSLFSGYAAKTGIGIFPKVLKYGDLEWSKNEDEQRYLYELIKAAKRAFKIDGQQIYCVGFSMGACGTWTTGSLFADIFAGIGLGGGGPCDAAFGNFMHTRVWFHHGTKDSRAPLSANQYANKALTGLKSKYPEFEFTYHEIPGLGHSWPRSDRDAMYKFIRGKKKVYFPKRFIWEPRVSWKKVFYWVAMENPARGSRIFVETKEKNVIHVEGTTDGTSLLLNDKIVDLSKPVKVLRHGTEIFNDVPKGSLTALILTLDDKLDEKAACWARISLSSK